ncbi:ABC transporter substrate-binding protein [Maridesulfovibrio sp. FT414]|uniref:ABC transporter substrate-binding protein n=1 Tax=Maridesulfovibrio sp. FT414 TaxID=2979469 RepID=UPI003D80557D
MKKLLTILLVLLYLASNASAETIEIGTVFELSGKDKATAQEAMNGAILAVQKLNGAASGLTVKLDTQSTSAIPEDIMKSVGAFGQNPNLQAVTGLISDDAALTAAPALQAAGVPFLCTGAQADGLAQSVGDYVFTLAVPDIRVGQLLADFAANTIQTDHIAVIRSDLSDSCARQADSFVRRYKQNGGTIMAEMRITESNANLNFITDKLQELVPPPPSNSTKVEDEVGVSNFVDSGASIITEAREAVPAPPQVESLIIFAPPEPATQILGQLKQKNTVYRIIAGSSFDTVPMQKTIKEWPDTVFYAAQASLTREDTLVQTFVKAYTDLFGSAPVTGYSALGFDSIMLLAETAKQHGAGKNEIRSGLPEIQNFASVSGQISFQGRAAHKPLYIIQSISGQISLAAGLD